MVSGVPGSIIDDFHVFFVKSCKHRVLRLCVIFIRAGYQWQVIDRFADRQGKGQIGIAAGIPLVVHLILYGHRNILRADFCPSIILDLNQRIIDAALGKFNAMCVSVVIIACFFHTRNFYRCTLHHPRERKRRSGFVIPHKVLGIL